MYKYPKFSTGTPEEYIISPTSVAAVWKGIEGFFEDRFRGAVVCKGDVLTYGYTDVSTEGIAYFFKVLLNSIFGKSTLKVTASTEQDSFTLSAECALDIKDSVRQELLRIAHLSGFTAEFSKDGDILRIDLKMAVNKVAYLSLYATEITKVHEVFVRVFFLI